MVLSAQRLYERGVDHGNAGRNVAAQRDLSAALSRTDDVDLRAQITGTLAYIASRRGDPATAERLCREGLADTRVGETTRAILFGQLGALALMRGDWAEARGLLTKSIDGMAGDAARAGRMRINRSVAAMQLGDFVGARADLRSAAETFERLDDAVERAKSLHNLGYVELLAGDLVQALSHMSAARPAFEAQSPVAAAQSDLDRADVLRDAGLTTEAESILERVARTFGSHGMRQARAEAELSLARSLLLHDPAAAAKVARVAARRFGALGSKTWALRAEALRMQGLLATTGPVHGPATVRKARTGPEPEAIEQLASDLDQRGFRDQAAALRMAHDLERARRGDLDQPRPVRVPPAASMEVRLLAYEVRAARAEAAGRTAEARRHAAAGLDALGGWHRTFGSLDLQTSFAMHGRGLMLAGLRAAVRSRRPDIVFDWSERVRHLNQEVQPLRPPPDPIVADQLAELRMLRADDPDGAWLQSPRAAELQHLMRERQWSGTGSGGIQQRVALPELVDALGHDAGLLSFVYTREAMLALVVAGDHASLIDLPGWPAAHRAMQGLRADLDMAASVRSGRMAQVVRAALDDRLAALSELLMDPVLRAVGDRRLVLTTPGIMGGIPWAMLPALRGRVFTQAISASRWTSFRSAPRRSASAGFAAGPRVQRGQEEVETAAGSWSRATVIGGAGATVSGVAELASDVDILHVAAHGRHAVDNPLFSGLELVDGALFGYDIDQIPRVPDAVVLSACEAGRSSVRWGEEAIGITRVWLHAGARCVIAAPVIVADDEACELLGAMHEGLAAGQAPAEALAAASARTGIVAPFQSHGAGF